jgi:alkylation response protein AidB-like acyl-CoA dehydrogenase
MTDTPTDSGPAVTTDELIAAIGELAGSINTRFGREYYLSQARDNKPPTELYQAMADAGLFALGVPEEVGGAGGGLVATAAVMESMSRFGTPPMLFALTSFARHAILRHGTPEQIEAHVVPSLKGERKISFAVTEPDAGTNTFAMRTTARRDDGGNYLLNGQKVFISGADQADHMLVVARTPSESKAQSKTEGISLFVLPAGTAGVTMQPLNIDWKAPERQFSVYFDNVVLPPESLIGIEGQGLRSMFDSMNAERVVVAAWALGLGYYALSKAVAYAKERAPWGTPIGAYQSVAHPLARARAQLDAARTMNYRAAERFDEGGNAGAEANMAKYLASEAAHAAMDAVIQTHGGSAFDADTDVITLWPMIRLLRIAPINNEMVLNYISERVLGLPRSY